MGSIAIVGLEPDAQGIPDIRAVGRLRQATIVVVPSATGASVEMLSSLAITPQTFEGLGLAADASTSEVVEALLRLAETDDVALVAAGYPLIRDGLISAFLSRTSESIDVFPVVSPLQVLMLALDIDMTADLELLDAEALGVADLRRDAHLIVTGVHNAFQVHTIAERLRHFYDRAHSVVMASGLSAGGFQFTRLTIAELASTQAIPRESALYLPPTRIETPDGFVELVRTIAALRAPDGCPWDRAQTHASLAPHMVEEAYEAVAAIESGETATITDELGDVLLQVVLNAQIGADEGTFTIDDVIAGISAKIRRRHPHIFGAAVAETVEDVTRTWDAVKREERQGSGVVADVPAALPALVRAQKISRRAAAAGFEWDDLAGVWEKVHEEIGELRAAELGSPEAEEELGDVLFTVVNVARTMGIDSETALRRTCDRFSRRFAEMEREAEAAGRTLDSLTGTEWDTLWDAAKRAERSGGAQA